MDSVQCVYGDSCVLPSVEFTKTGYSFDGWATSEDGDVQYTDGQTVSDLINGGEYDLYAKYVWYISDQLMVHPFSAAEANKKENASADPVNKHT